jgi:hypothetical protein
MEPQIIGVHWGPSCLHELSKRNTNYADIEAER